MARVRPFLAHTYRTPSSDISDLCAPPYDVISPAERARLVSRSPHNVAAIELPEGGADPALPGNRYANGAALWAEWVERKIVEVDDAPAFRVLEQRYQIDGRSVRRRALIAAVGLEPFEAGVILPHERTLPKALSDRLELLRATRLNSSAVFGLFSDAEGASDDLFDSATSGIPAARSVDDDGVESLLWRVEDPAWTRRFEELMAPKQVFIADGHHRYTVALAFRDEMRAAGAPTDASAPHESVMMALVNMDDPGLVVLPTHRVADALGAFDAAAFLSRLSETFDLTAVEAEGATNALADHAGSVAFVVGVRGRSEAWLARLRGDVDLDQAMGPDHTAEWNRLDVAVLQELVLDPLLSIHPDRPDTLDRLSFVKNAGEALAMTEGHDAVFLLNPTRMSQMKAVAIAGETMPQKSTYFYPKLPSGLVFRSLA